MEKSTSASSLGSIHSELASTEDVTKGEKSTSKNFFSNLTNYLSGQTSLNLEGAETKKELSAAKQNLKAGIKYREGLISTLEKKKEKLDDNDNNAEEIETLGQQILSLKEQVKDTKAALKEMINPTAEDEEPVLVEESDAMPPKASMDEETKLTDEESGAPKKVKDNLSALFSTKSTIGADFFPIAANTNKLETGRRFLQGALRVKLLMQNTELGTFTDRSNYNRSAQQFISKGFEMSVHSVTSGAAEIAGLLLLLPAAGLNNLVGDLKDVQNTYQNTLDKLGSNPLRKPVAALARLAHLIAFVAKEATVLTAAGLSVVVNLVLAMADKLASGIVSILTQAVFATFRNPKKSAIGGAVLGALGGAVALIVKYAPGIHVKAIAGAAIVAHLPAIGIALAAILGAYLILRAVRLAYNSYESSSQKEDRKAFKFSMKDSQKQKEIRLEVQARLLPLALSKAYHDSEVEEQEELTQAATHAGKDEAIQTMFGNDERVTENAFASRVKSTQSRAISSFIPTFGNKGTALLQDTKRTFTNWNAGNDIDVNLTQRALIKMTPEQLVEAITDYKVNLPKVKKANEVEQAAADTELEQEKFLVKQALFAALTAGKAIAEHEHSVMCGKGDVLNAEDLKANRTIARVFSGSDKQILDLAKKYTQDIDGTFYSTTLDEALAATDVEAKMNEVKIKRELATLEKDAKSMIAELYSKSGFKNYLRSESKIGVEITQDGALDVTDEDGDSIISVESKPTTKAPFSNEMFVDMFEVNKEFEYTATSTLTTHTKTVASLDESGRVHTDFLGPVGDDNAATLVELYNKYKKLYPHQKMAFRMQSEKKTAAPESVEGVSEGDRTSFGARAKAKFSSVKSSVASFFSSEKKETKKTEGQEAGLPGLSGRTSKGPVGPSRLARLRAFISAPFKRKKEASGKEDSFFPARFTSNGRNQHLDHTGLSEYTFSEDDDDEAFVIHDVTTNGLPGVDAEVYGGFDDVDADDSEI